MDSVRNGRRFEKKTSSGAEHARRQRQSTAARGRKVGARREYCRPRQRKRLAKARNEKRELDIGSRVVGVIVYIRRRSLTRSSERRDISEGWISKLLVRKIEPTKESHSRMLSDKEVIYALHTHNIRPDSIDKYLAN